jgi:NAD(P)-dependent dehydrogenase (short-subunit alcohol dehydrogenase family)
MDLKLKGKIALVTGAGSQIGYGKSIAITLAREGCDVIVSDIDIEGAQKTASEVQDLGRRSVAFRVNVADRSDVDKMVQTILDQWKRIDILVNNAGASSQLKPFVQMTRSDWEVDIGVNLIGQMNMAQAVLPAMISRKYGRIINLSGGQGIPNISIYGAAKAGVEAFTLSLAREVGRMGVIVNGIAPGLGETGLVANAPRDFLDANARSSSLGRLCTPEDVAPVAAFLASDVCSYMAGQFVRIHAA